MTVMCSGSFSSRLQSLDYAMYHETALSWQQDKNFNATFSDIFVNCDIPVEINSKNPTKFLYKPAPFYNASAVWSLIRPKLLCRAEEKAMSLGLNIREGVELGGEIEDRGQLFFVCVHSRQQIIDVGAQWKDRAVFYRRKVWGNHRKEGVEESVVNFLILAMAAHINVSTYNGYVAAQLGGVESGMV